MEKKSPQVLSANIFSRNNLDKTCESCAFFCLAHLINLRRKLKKNHSEPGQKNLKKNLKKPGKNRQKPLELFTSKNISKIRFYTQIKTVSICSISKDWWTKRF